VPLVTVVSWPSLIELANDLLQAQSVAFLYEYLCPLTFVSISLGLGKGAMMICSSRDRISLLQGLVSAGGRKRWQVWQLASLVGLLLFQPFRQY
jgi:hypothetical protein